jgi:putative membrane protein
MAAVAKLMSSVVAVLLVFGIANAALAIEALPDAQFVGFIQQANDFELDSSRLALQKSENQAIHIYAKRLMSERSQIAIELSRARSEARIGYVPTTGGLRSRYISVLDRLHTLDGEAFDKAYAEAQLKAQLDITDEVGAYAREGTNAELRRFAVNVLPRLQSQLEHARQLAER